MNFASDPITGFQINAEQYIARFGRKPLGSTVDSRPRARCEVCRQEVSHVAGKTEDSHSHFSHLPNGGYCPTKSDAAAPYGRLTPGDPDREHGRQIRGQVLQRWKWVFYVLKNYVPYFDAEEFVMLIRSADQDRVWEYRNLHLAQVPELLLMIRDFTPETSRVVRGQKRKFWFRFWFSANIRQIEDLWIEPPENVRLIRSSYEAPKGRQRLPKIQVKQIEMERTLHIPPTDPDIEYPFALSRIPRALRIEEN